jgi:GNAT superfamily N-acetyltransferase
MDLSIRQLTEADVDRADAILMSAFSPESRAADLRRYLRLQPDGWFLATTPAGPVGMVGTVDYGPFAYVGMMAVHPQAQRQGIGTTLMQHLLAWLAGRGTPMALLDASEAGYPVYRRLVFVECDRTLIYQSSGSPAASLPAGVRQLEPGELDALSEFDTAVFGANRKRVLESLTTSLAGRIFVTEDESGKLSGCLFALPRRLGPWIARQPKDAERLLQAALTLSYTAPILVTVPGMNLNALGLLERSGFVRVNASHRHMRRGGSGLPSQRELIYGQMSFAIG